MSSRKEKYFKYSEHCRFRTPVHRVQPRVLPRPTILHKARYAQLGRGYDDMLARLAEACGIVQACVGDGGA